MVRWRVLVCVRESRGAHPPPFCAVMKLWLEFRPPAKVCVSMQGIFSHHEIDQ